MKLKRFVVGKSTSAKTQAEAYNQQSAFCKNKGGRLPTKAELCPAYDESKETSTVLGCEKAHSWYRTPAARKTGCTSAVSALLVTTCAWTTWRLLVNTA